ncbi:MAG: hypothetical protein JSV84_06920 [Gemmatimonadota bacterium]|nr:MAG: hypothetical protein JSV84_06920 [Gemmatimonadota bacterium]
MTHTLHRLGNPQSLRKDFIVLAIASQIAGPVGSAYKFREFADIVLKYNPLNFGDMISGNMFQMDLDTIHAGYCDNSIVHAVFTDEHIVANVLKELKDADLGLSIVVSGLLEQTATCCSTAGLKPHTVQYSLGILGRTDLLPQPWVLEMSTMCGHGMVAFSLIIELADRVKDQRITAEEAAQGLARQCHCGVFNPDRATGILKRIVTKKSGKTQASKAFENEHDEALR